MKNQIGREILCVGAFISCLFLPIQGYGWDRHQTLMPFILNAPIPTLKALLLKKGRAPCPKEDKKVTQELIKHLQINPATRFSASLNPNCNSNSYVSVEQILLGEAVDEPDFEMDQDLGLDNPKVDPRHDRRWMGGFKGSSSQGFRHMYFGGWRAKYPIASFQLPFWALGESPGRVELIAQKAKQFIQAGDFIWGIRLLGWAMHYIQDLSQPFHAAQIPSFQMVPWKALWIWPPTEIFPNLVRETTRTISNFHISYEEYTMGRILKGTSSVYARCLKNPEFYSNLSFNPKTETPADLAFRVIDASIGLAPKLGAAEIDFFGTHLRDPGVDIKKQKVLDYEELANRADLAEARHRLDEVTCTALANTSQATRFLLEWAFQP